MLADILDAMVVHTLQMCCHARNCVGAVSHVQAGGPAVLAEILDAKVDNVLATRALFILNLLEDGMDQSDFEAAQQDPKTFSGDHCSGAVLSPPDIASCIICLAAHPPPDKYHLRGPNNRPSPDWLHFLADCMAWLIVF